MVELRAHHARRPLATRAAGEDQGLEGGQTEGRACGLQFHEGKSAAADDMRPSRLRVHQR
jgi:hypothetical protein